MQDYEIYQVAGKLTTLLFVAAFGACVGSLTNVLVYRLPLGLDVVRSPSRCPACGTRLTWRENIPILGWLLLGGKCRFCKSRISAEYVLVELFVALLFAGVFALWYMVPDHAHWLGVDWSLARPEWVRGDLGEPWPRTTWAPFLVVLILLGSLNAMTLVDAKTFTIPLVLPWFATLVGVGLHTLGAAVEGKLLYTAPGTGWAIPIPGGSFSSSTAAWWWLGASFGGMLGLALSMVFLHFGLIRRSFMDYAEWEERALRERAAATGQSQETSPPTIDQTAQAMGATVDADHRAAGPVGTGVSDGAAWVVKFVLVWLVTVVLGGVASWLLPRTGIHLQPWWGLVAGAALGPIVAALATRHPSGEKHGLAASAERSPAQADSGPGPVADDDPTHMWIQYPHARREMLKELIFLTPCIGLAWLGGTLLSHFGGSPLEHRVGHTPPLWLLVLGGTFMGYLIGGGVVWGLRIFGSLAFGKEAMGLGDVHLMAAVGACLGWIDAAIAFPLAAFVGLYCWLIGRIRSGDSARAMPFGPSLAVATVLVLLAKPLVEMGLSALAGRPINLP